MIIKKVFIASPLFNEKERQLNEEVDLILRQAGYETFLAQKDGFLYRDIVEEMKKQGIKNPEITALNLIYHIDMYQACEICDATVLNMNGRVPDEGALVESALCFRSEKPLVIYKDDSRSLIDGRDNPLIIGMTGLEIVNRIEDIPKKLRELERLADSQYSTMITNARALFKDYNLKTRDLPKLIEVFNRL